MSTDPWILISKCAAEQKIPEEPYNVTEGEDLIPGNKEREAGFISKWVHGLSNKNGDNNLSTSFIAVAVLVVEFLLRMRLLTLLLGKKDKN